MLFLSPKNSVSLKKQQHLFKNVKHKEFFIRSFQQISNKIHGKIYIIQINWIYLNFIRFIINHKINFLIIKGTSTTLIYDQWICFYDFPIAIYFHWWIIICCSLTISFFDNNLHVTTQEMFKCKLLLSKHNLR